VNVELLQQIKARILAEPDAFRMDTWSCGTAHCIAGWACALVGDPVVVTDALPAFQLTVSGRYPADVASEALGLGKYLRDYVCPADSLFLDEAWPPEFAYAYDDALCDDDGAPLNTSDARRKRAEIAADRIDHFIATNGAE
jgi:hypothetical protein